MSISSVSLGSLPLTAVGSAGMEDCLTRALVSVIELEVAIPQF